MGPFQAILCHFKYPHQVGPTSLRSNRPSSFGQPSPKSECYVFKLSFTIALQVLFPLMHFDLQLQNGSWGTCRACDRGRTHWGWWELREEAWRSQNIIGCARLLYVSFNQAVEEEVLPPACMDLNGFPLKTDIFEGSCSWHLKTKIMPF